MRKRFDTKPSGSSIRRRKAAAEGAIVWYIKQLVGARATRHTLGVQCDIKYDINNPLHLERAGRAYRVTDGELGLPSCFDVLVKKVSLL